MKEQASIYSRQNSRPRVPSTLVWLRVLGLISPVGLPLLGIWIQERFSIFQAPDINSAIPVGFFLAGIVTGALIRGWWSITYIFTLGFVLTILSLALTDEYPGSDSDAITLALAFILIPIMMLGAAFSTLAGTLIDRRWPRGGRHGNQG